MENIPLEQMQRTYVTLVSVLCHLQPYEDVQGMVALLKVHLMETNLFVKVCYRQFHSYILRLYIFCLKGIICFALADVPDNGRITYSNEANGDGNYPFSTTATYVCDDGFGLVDGPALRECSGDGSRVFGLFIGMSSTCAGKLLKAYSYSD